MVESEQIHLEKRQPCKPFASHGLLSTETMSLMAIFSMTRDFNVNSR